VKLSVLTRSAPIGSFTCSTIPASTTFAPIRNSRRFSIESLSHTTTLAPPSAEYSFCRIVLADDRAFCSISRIAPKLTITWSSVCRPVGSRPGCLTPRPVLMRAITYLTHNGIRPENGLCPYGSLEAPHTIFLCGCGLFLTVGRDGLREALLCSS